MSEISREVIPFEKGGIRCHLHGGKVPGKRRYLWENQLLSFFLENALKSLKLDRVSRLLLAKGTLLGELAFCHVNSSSAS